MDADEVSDKSLWDEPRRDFFDDLSLNVSLRFLPHVEVNSCFVVKLFRAIFLRLGGSTSEFSSLDTSDMLAMDQHRLRML